MTSRNYGLIIIPGPIEITSLASDIIIALVEILRRGRPILLLGDGRPTLFKRRRADSSPTSIACCSGKL